MAGNSFGTLFRITTWGESHGPAVGAVIDGCPAGIKIALDDIQREVDRRKPSGATETARREEDRVEILSGIFEGITTGMPISLLVKNKDARSSDYDALKNVYRPGHADMTYEMKYGIRDYRGGGRASGRETVARVMAGAVAKRVLGATVEVIGHTVQIGPHRVEAAMKAYVEEVRAARDSIGGIIEILIRGAPTNVPANPLAGLGEPVFDRLNADLGKALFSIPAVKSVSFGRGMDVATMKGSEHNAARVAGGILGGIATGDEITIQIAVKPPSSIGIGGRHDACIAPRIIPVAESMVAIVLADHLLRNRAAKI